MAGLSFQPATKKAPGVFRTYQLGGVNIHSSITMPGIPEVSSGSEATLLVREATPEEFQRALAGLIRPQAEAPYEELTLVNGAYIRWQQDLEYLVEPGGRIAWRKMQPQLSDAALRSFTFGHVFSYAIAISSPLSCGAASR